MRGGVAHAPSFPHAVTARPQGRQRPPSRLNAGSGGNSNARKRLGAFVAERVGRDFPSVANPQALVTGTTFDGEVVPAVLPGQHQNGTVHVRQEKDRIPLRVRLWECSSASRVPSLRSAASPPLTRPPLSPSLALTGNAAEQTAQERPTLCRSPRC